MTSVSISEKAFRKPSFCLEVFLTGRVLVCWTDSRIDVSTVSGIDTVARRIELKTGGAVSCQITERPPDRKEHAFIQQQRFSESNKALAARSSAPKTRPKVALQPPAPPPEINDTILWHVQCSILDELDASLKSVPSASHVFILYCRDRMSLATMSRQHGWPYRTLRKRKAALEVFLKDKFNLTLEAFFVDRSIFGAAERQMRDRRARHISARALGDSDQAEEDT
jgi:hypothetical protein